MRKTLQTSRQLSSLSYNFTKAELADCRAIFPSIQAKHTVLKQEEEKVKSKFDKKFRTIRYKLSGTPWEHLDYMHKVNKECSDATLLSALHKGNHNLAINTINVNVSSNNATKLLGRFSNVSRLGHFSPELVQLQAAMDCYQEALNQKQKMLEELKQLFRK